MLDHKKRRLTRLVEVDGYVVTVCKPVNRLEQLHCHRECATLRLFSPMLHPMSTMWPEEATLIEHFGSDDTRIVSLASGQCCHPNPRLTWQLSNKKHRTHYVRRFLRLCTEEVVLDKMCLNLDTLAHVHHLRYQTKLMQEGPGLVETLVKWSTATAIVGGAWQMRTKHVTPRWIVSQNCWEK